MPFVPGRLHTRLARVPLLLAGGVITLALPAGAAPAPAPARGAATPAVAAPASTAELLIAELADPDPAVRERAVDRLVALGARARPEVLTATRSPNPEQRARAAQVLRRLPWWTDDDPPEVRSTLARYGQASDAARAQVLRRLGDLSAVGPLLRLLNEEPSDSLRWGIVMLLWLERDADALARMRDFKPADDDPAALMLAGRAWAERDRAKALDYFRRAVEADASRPSGDGGLLGIAVQQVLAADIEAGRLDAAAGLLRRQVPRHLARAGTGRRSSRRMMLELGLTSPAEASVIDLGLGGRPTSSLAALLALHEHVGPLRGWEQDLTAWVADPRAAVGRSPLLASASQLFARLGAPVPLPLGLTRGLDAEDRLDAAAFLARVDLTAAAEAELRAALESPGRAPHVETNVLLLLSRLTGAREDDAVTAHYLERALTLRTKHDLQWEQGEEDDLRAELAFRRARAAHAKGDAVEADQHVRALLDCNPSGSDLAITMVRWLKETGRAAPAKALFERLYQQGKERLDTTPSAGARNDLAWLCARCGERLGEAVELAKAAVEEDPDNAAFLDTYAEAAYRAGDRAKAIELESRALELRPTDKFMREQLERFRQRKP